MKQDIRNKVQTLFTKIFKFLGIAMIVITIIYSAFYETIVVNNDSDLTTINRTSTTELQAGFIPFSDKINQDAFNEIFIQKKIIYPYDLGLTNWKITLPRNYSGRTDDSGYLLADEVFLNKNKNHFKKDSSFKKYQDEFFYVTKKKNIRFECAADPSIPKTSQKTTNTRTELREMPSNGDKEKGWDANSEAMKTLEFEVRIIQTSNTKKFAFAQIHDFKQSVWDDLLRIQVQSEKPNAIRGGLAKIYVQGDLIEGEPKDGFPVDFKSRNYGSRYIHNNYVLGSWLKMKITVQNSVVNIYLGNMKKPKRTYTDVSCPSNYFKLGVYNQSMSSKEGGVSIAEFRNVKVSNNF